MSKLSHAIPISISSPPGITPAGALTAEIFWVDDNGQIAKDLVSVPVQNGVADYQGPPLAPRLSWAIRITETATGGPVFRSGPLRALPGHTSPVLSTGEVTIFHTRVGFGLNLPDGLPEVVTEHLQSLPLPLRFERADLGADADGRYVVTVHGTFGWFFSFRYLRTLRLVPNREPGRPAPPVLALPEGAAQSDGLAIFFRGTLDKAIIDAVQAQLAAALSRLASLELQIHGPDFEATTLSVSAIALSQGLPGSEIETSVTLDPGAITGQMPVPEGPIEEA